MLTLFEPTASKHRKIRQRSYCSISWKRSGRNTIYSIFCKEELILKITKHTIQNFTNAIYKGQKWVKEHTAKEIAGINQKFLPRHGY